jgi:SAM-dependent methyltransferase
MPSDLMDSNKTYNSDFSDYYDRLNQHKDYFGEAAKLDGVIRQHVKSVRPRILDIGCGTGQHAVLLSGKGHDITAIDLSPDMIRIAKNKRSDVNFLAGNIAELNESNFEFAYSLFNVVNCLNSIDELTAFFKAIGGRLVEGAFFLVESWNPIAVIAVPPTVVERVYDTGDEKIVRKVSPSAGFFRQRLDLTYDIDVFSNDAHNKKLHSFSIVHKLVLFTPLEIEYCLKSAGFRDVAIYTALPDLAPATASDRMLAIVAQKAGQ